jgi:hypothetical protein
LWRNVIKGRRKEIRLGIRKERGKGMGKERIRGEVIWQGRDKRGGGKDGGGREMIGKGLKRRRKGRRGKKYDREEIRGLEERSDEEGKW